jgi:hypothetical protein
MSPPTIVSFREKTSKTLGNHLPMIGILFWFVSLFPARIGHDGKLLLDMIQKNESSDTWSSGYYHFIRVTTLNSELLFMPTIITTTLIVFSLIWVVSKLIKDVKSQKRISKLLLFSPFIGFTGMTLSHDVFLTVALLLMVGLFKAQFDGNLSQKEQMWSLITLCFCLVMFHSGIFFFALLIINYVSRKQLRLIVYTTFLFLALLVGSKVGVSQNKHVGEFIGFVVMDLKCVAQHPQADLSSKDWSFLETYGPREVWETPVSCERNEIPEKIMRDKMIPNLDFYLQSFRILVKHPYLTLGAHIQRSRGALPPPFFLGPQNQVDYSDNIPLGLKTNTALQDKPGIFHPSVDFQSENATREVRIDAVQYPAQLYAFVLNQASWFWGWAGFWLWPILVWLHLTYRKNRRSIDKVWIISPLLLQHFIIFVVAPALARYLMATIILGIITSVLLIFEREKAIYEED